MIILRASTHQGHSQFRGKGRQCVAISTMAILESQKTPPGDWDPYQLDSLLQKGDELYMKIISKYPESEYLTFNDVSNTLSDLNMIESIHGTIDSNYCATGNFPFLSLKDGLNEVFGINSQCLLTMGNSTPCYSSAVIKDREKFYHFDSHSRGDTGMLAPDGAACTRVHQ